MTKQHEEACAKTQETPSLLAKVHNFIDLESFKLHAKDSIELLMSVDSDMNPFRDRPVLNEIMADIRRASSLEELRKTINECLDAVKNVVATYVELNRVIEEMQGELVWKKH